MSPGARASVLRALSFLGGLGVLVAFWWLGGWLSGALRLPLPGSIVGMLLLWAALSLGLVRLSWVESGARGLLSVLGLLFIPAGAGLVRFLDRLDLWVVAALVIAVGALVSLAVAGHVVQRSARPESHEGSSSVEGGA